MRAADIFAQGYAVAMHDCVKGTFTWVFNEKTVAELPMAVLWPEDIPNTNWKGAPIEKVLDAARKANG